jgi:hypothetical protein
MLQTVVYAWDTILLFIYSLHNSVISITLPNPALVPPLEHLCERIGWEVAVFPPSSPLPCLSHAQSWGMGEHTSWLTTSGWDRFVNITKLVKVLVQSAWPCNSTHVQFLSLSSTSAELAALKPYFAKQFWITSGIIDFHARTPYMASKRREPVTTYPFFQLHLLFLDCWDPTNWAHLKHNNYLAISTVLYPRRL